MTKTRQRVAIIGVFMMLQYSLFLGLQPAIADVIYEYDFENGWDYWSADNGVWEVGTPDPLNYPPPDPHGGLQCAGTVLDGFYPPDTDSHLISPSIILPSVTGDEEISLRFWHWFSYEHSDNGFVQIRVYDYGSGNWSDWQQIGESIEDTSPVWSYMVVDLTDYDGEKVKIGFFHTAASYGESWGWYIDDVQILKKVPEFTGNFEAGWGDWGADNGIWQVGTPDPVNYPPPDPHGGLQCAGTVLNGLYEPDTDSRLISPSTWLPTITGNEELYLGFWHWFSYEHSDKGYVDISVYDDATGEWSVWYLLGDPIENSSDWSRKDIDISNYAGKKARIGFRHTAASYGESWGWYVDDVEIYVFPPTPQDPVPDIKANGLDGPLFTTVGDTVDITISLDSGDMSGLPCDWWIGTLTPFGNYWLDAPKHWVYSNTPVTIGQIPLFDLSPVSQLTTNQLPVGFYFFFIVLDDNPNGIFDNMTWYDYVVVSISY